MALLSDKVVLVSGGTQGVGAGVARAAVREGAAVAVTGRRREPGEALAAELAATGATARFVQARWRPWWPSWAGSTAWSTRPG
jgi:NAD(P)-dependent dehydrogenase (short-subunit alcohol dehydrogenase family)